MIKHLAIAATVVCAGLVVTPAFAGGHGGGKNSLAIGAALTTGKGGLLGSLLGSNNRGHGATQGIALNTLVTTTKGGILGLVLGGYSGGSSHHGGYGY